MTDIIAPCFLLLTFMYPVLRPMQTTRARIIDRPFVQPIQRAVHLLRNLELRQRLGTVDIPLPTSFAYRRL
jgi:hypothetical protein